MSVLLRASDPFFETMLLLGGHEKENVHWRATLSNLAARFGVEGHPTVTQVCVDGRRQWRYASNIRDNAAIRSGLHRMVHPRLWLGRPSGT